MAEAAVRAAAEAAAEAAIVRATADEAAAARAATPTPMTAPRRATQPIARRGAASAPNTHTNAQTSRGGKGVRADFLLNFRTPEHGASAARAAVGAAAAARPVAAAGPAGGARNDRAPARRTARRGVYRKELFLQANFRFLVADWADLKGSATDPDHMVDWDDVVLVEAGAREPLSCPVCFDEPPRARR